MPKPWGKLRGPRVGVMIHYDASGSDEGARSWRYLAGDVSYQANVLDDGEVLWWAPDDARAWHAGTCRPSEGFQYRDANSAFYGVAAALRPPEKITERQLDSLAAVVRMYFRTEGWGADDLWRITGHADEAWPRGRKADPVGNKNDPCFTVEQVREAVRKIL